MTPSNPPKLIVLRGNSGSGKSTVAKRLREVSTRKIAIVEQDYLRRFILKEKEVEHGDNIDLIFQTVAFSLEHGYDVILEGILYFPRYGAMLAKLVEFVGQSYFYYFEVSLEETIRRHATKPNSHEFGETELRSWYRPLDLTGFKGEVVIPEVYSVEQSVQAISAQTKL